MCSVEVRHLHNIQSDPLIFFELERQHLDFPLCENNTTLPSAPLHHTYSSTVKVGDTPACSITVIKSMLCLEIYSNRGKPWVTFPPKWSLRYHSPNSRVECVTGVWSRVIAAPSTGLCSGTFPFSCSWQLLETGLQPRSLHVWNLLPSYKLKCLFLCSFCLPRIFLWGWRKCMTSRSWY